MWFVQAKSNIAPLGPPGVGKTMIAVAFGVTACQTRYSIYSASLDDLVRRLRPAEATGRSNRQLAGYLRLALLVVDRLLHHCGVLAINGTERGQGQLDRPDLVDELPNSHPHGY